jgi:hypothetical protein
MLDSIAQFTGSAIGVIAIVGFLTAVGLYFWIPFNVWRVARNTARIASRLDRIADALENNSRGSRDEFRELELQRRARG